MNISNIRRNCYASFLADIFSKSLSSLNCPCNSLVSFDKSIFTRKLIRRIIWMDFIVRWPFKFDLYSSILSGKISPWRLHNLISANIVWINLLSIGLRQGSNLLNNKTRELNRYFVPLSKQPLCLHVNFSKPNRN